MDEAKLEAFMGMMVGYMTGSAMCFAAGLGDELGLYRVNNSPLSLGRHASNHLPVTSPTILNW